jgi:hypothetical protein
VSPPDAPGGEAGDPVPLLDSRHGAAPLLRVYLRETQPPEGDSAAAWQRLEHQLEGPPPAPRRPTALFGALAAACLTIWALAPPRADPPGAPIGLDAAGGAPGTHAARGGTEGAGGVERRPPE